MELNVRLDALQSLTNFTDHSQQEQNDVNCAHSNRNVENCESGLGGVLQRTAFAVGQERDALWNSKLLPQLQTLVENNTSATSTYFDRQDIVTHRMAESTYGINAVINGSV